MIQRSMRRLTSAATLACMLTLTAPAHAADWRSWTPEDGFLQDLWTWAVSLWAPAAPSPLSSSTSLKSDRGSGIDPNGTTSTATASGQTDSDRGSGLDPNG
jgi:hypothetical protein